MQGELLIQVKNIIKTSKPDGIVTKLRHNTELWPVISEYTKNFQFQNKSEQVYFYAEQLTSKPQCKCGRLLTFISIVSGYREFCSRSCTYAKKAALDRRVAAMERNGGVGLANPKTYLKAKGKLQEKYGKDVINPGQIKTHRENMALDNPMFVFETRVKNKDAFFRQYYTEQQYNFLFNKLEFQNVVKGKNAVQLGNEYELSSNLILKYARKYDVLNTMNFQPHSAMELDFEEWLIKKSIKYKKHDRSILSNRLELDFYFPEHNLAVELNGLYHHSELAGKKSRLYRWQKYKECQEKGIQLIQIWQDEYWKCKNVVQNKILYLTNNLKKKIGARTLFIDKVSLCDEREFYSKNHIQGFPDYRSFSLAAYHNGVVVGCISWCKNKGYWEIVRYATKLDAVYPGLFSRLMKHSLICFNISGTIVSFSDNRISNGKMYASSGFTLEKELRPGYCYTSDYSTRSNRQNFMKHKMLAKHNLTESYVKSKTEWEITQELGYDRLWDAGKRKWVYTI